MNHPITQRILHTKVVSHGENAVRHVHTLECGHEVVRAPRKTYQRRAVCEECGNAQKDTES